MSDLQFLADLALNVTGRDRVCQGWPHGDTMTVSSCEDAIAQVPDTTSALSGPNGAPLNIPVSYSSCKSLDPVHAESYYLLITIKINDFRFV